MITLIGATGFTGQLIAAELKKHKCHVRLAARDERKLHDLAEDLGGGFETVTADVTAPAGLSAAMDGCSVVINCAGPFTDLGEPVVREAVRQRAHYLDTTGEQGFIRKVYEKFGPSAAERGSALIPACAFEYALSDAGAEMAAETLEESVREVQVVYHVNTLQASRGTLKSVARVISQEGYQLRGGAPVPVRFGAMHRQVRIPDEGEVDAYSFPGGEVFMLPLHMDVEVVSTLAAVPVPRPLLDTVSGILPALVGSPLRAVVDWLSDLTGFGPGQSKRESSKFTVLVSARGNERDTTVVIRGNDPYGTTAVIAAHLGYLADKGEVTGAGPVSPAMACGFKSIVEATTPAGLQWSLV